MNGNELLRPGGEKRGGLDASLAAEDLELTRLSQLLFPGLGAEEALDFAFGLLTDDGETIRLRQEILGDLLDHPALRETMEKLRSILEELETRIDDSLLDAFEGRLYGRISEIIFNVWLDRQIETGAISTSSVKVLPLVYIEKVDWFRKGVSFLKAKFFNKKYTGSF